MSYISDNNSSNQKNMKLVILEKRINELENQLKSSNNLTE